MGSMGVIIIARNIETVILTLIFKITVRKNKPYFQIIDFYQIVKILYYNNRN